MKERKEHTDLFRNTVWLYFSFQSCIEGYIRALGSYIAPFTRRILTMSVFVLQMEKIGTKDWEMRSHKGY